MKSCVFKASVAALPLLLALPALAQAQPVPSAPSAAEAQAALNPPPPIHYTPAQLDQMLAPIALYPDQLLTQLLMAATFPDQLIDARKWLEDPKNAVLKGDVLANALLPLPWDPSVKSLASFPQIIVMMVDYLDWTEALGAAFAAQEVEIFARVQFLRDRAAQAGHLKSTPQLAVRREETDIIIEPAHPDEIYVPVYNPAEVYGDWPDANAPPVYIPPPPNFYNGPVGAGIGFSIGFGVVAPLWDWGHPDWRHHQVDIDRARYEHITKQTYITRNHIEIEGGAWHRSAPVAFVPEAQRPHPPREDAAPPRGTIRPSAMTRPGPPGSGPAGPNAGPRPAGETAPHPEEHATPPHPEEHAAPPHPEEHAAPPHPEEHTAPPHPEQHAAPPRPEEHAAPPHPEEHAAPPRPEEHAVPPHPEEHAAPPHREQHAAPPAQGSTPQAHPGPPQRSRPKPGEDHQDDHH